MNNPPVKKHSGRTRRGWVVHQILRSIFSGEFRGGDRLVEEEVAATIGVSRTPVREAFSELAGIGLIVIKPNHGAVVRPFGPTQIREMYQIRCLLEGEATRLAAERIEPAALRDMRSRMQQFLTQPRSATWSAEMVEADQEFHQLIGQNCGSTRLAEEIERYQDIVQTIRQVVGNTSQAQDIAIVEHTQILDALLAHDATGAADAMVRHIRRGTDAAVSALFSSIRQGHRQMPKAFDLNVSGGGGKKVKKDEF